MADKNETIGGSTVENSDIQPERPPSIEERLDRLEEYIALIAEPNLRRKDPSRSIHERIADRLETSAYSRILISIGAVLAVFSFVGIGATAIGIGLQYQSMQEESVARAWQSLATAGLGNAGKASALRLVHERGEPLSGINIGGDSRLTSSELPDLHLVSASIGDSDWRHVVLDAVHLESADFYRMRLDGLYLSGTLDDVEIVWSDGSDSRFHLKSDSRLSIDTSIFDQTQFFIQAGRQLNGISTDTNFRVKEDGRVLLDTEEEEIAALRAAGEVVSFQNVSLRCALIPIEHTVNYAFESSNLSGAYIGYPYYFEDEPESAIARIPSEEWEKFRGAWYFSDNPPIGVPEKELQENFVAVDRAKTLAQCKKYEPRAGEPNPLMALEGVDGIETACVSLAAQPNICRSQYPSRILYMIGNSELPKF